MTNVYEPISIIICSINNEYLSRIRLNIDRTIGIPYEIIVIENAINKHSLAKAYNYGAGLSLYEHLVFLHEDIEFLTANWGSILIEHLMQKDVGLVGVAGGKYKSIVPSSWSIFKQLRSINVVQQYKFSDKSSFIHKEGNDNIDSLDVVAIDGLLMATKKNIWNEFKFDEHLLDGFHGYDVDFSLQISQKFRIKAINNIQLIHFSEGNHDKQWMKYAMAISDKWNKYLPQGVIPIVKADANALHREALQYFGLQLVHLRYPFYSQISLVIKYGFFYYPSLASLQATATTIFILSKMLMKNLLKLKFGLNL